MSDIIIHSEKLSKTYTWGMVGLGAFVFFLSAFRFDPQSADLRLIFLAAVTLLLSSRIIVPIPRFCSQISVSDTFIFLTLLLYGGEAAVVIAGCESFLSSLRFSRKPKTILFNWACGACSAFITAGVLKKFFADVIPIHSGSLSARFIAAVSVMALVQYVANSGIVAICGALKAHQPVWQTWKKYYLWTSITYFSGAFASAVIAELIDEVGSLALVITVPVIVTVFLTYRTYLKNIEASTAQAEQAENHVQELSHYIAEQERIREQFSQMEKLSALGELASGVAHDFNNTLAGILGRAQLLLRTNDPEKINKGLSIIIKAAEDGAKTVKRIQDFARQRRDHDFEPVAVDQILFDVSEITRPRWKDRAEASNIHISLDLQIRSKLKVLGDESELREVLVNMVFNAVDAMPAGGVLTLSSEDKDDSVVISVSDTGSGMAPEVRNRIFDPFFTTKGKAGMGLGLAVSFGIIRRHEGAITVDSEIGQGTTFRITLPAFQGEEIGSLAQQELSNLLDQAAATSGQNEAQLKILVVDDEECVRELLGDLLESENCSVHTASGGPEALALFDSREFNGVFTDVGMPGMSGWELASAIRQRDQKIPIAVITGWGEAVGSTEQKEAGVDWVITKPFTADRITELIRELDAQRNTNNQFSAFSVNAA